MSLLAMVQAREAVDKVCAAIDAGEIAPSEEAMMILAIRVSQVGGPLKHDLLCKLASRTKNGSAVLTRMAQ